MKRLFALLGLAAGISGQTQVTWSSDIACILYSHCTSCHRPGGLAPFSLMTYAEAQSNAAAIEDAVITHGEMPPWPPDQSYNAMAHNRDLTQTEKDRIADWVQAGAPMGNPIDAPAAPVYQVGPVLSNPDQIIRIPNFTLGAMSTDEYRCFPIQNTQNQTVYIKKLEVIPGNNGIVHHVLVFHDVNNGSWSLDSLDPGPGYTSFGGPGTNSANLLGGWVPGNDLYEAPLSMGIRVPAGGTFIVQVHYPLGSSGETDSTEIRMEFAGGTQRNITISPILNHVTTMVNGPLFVPANTVQTFHQQKTLFGNYSAVGILPHAHLLCTSMEAYAVLPNQDTVPLIRIPHWDFHWQGTYSFKSPVHLPNGTVLHGWATYDNTVNNPHNPSNPPINVAVGEATTDEMMLFYFFYTPYQSGDPNIPIDTSNHLTHHENCGADLLHAPSFSPPGSPRAFPNPSSGKLVVSGAEWAEWYAVFDVRGTELMRTNWSDLQREIDLTSLPAGTYWIQLGNNVHTSTLSVVLSL